MPHRPRVLPSGLLVVPPGTGSSTRSLVVPLEGVRGRGAPRRAASIPVRLPKWVQVTVGLWLAKRVAPLLESAPHLPWRGPSLGAQLLGRDRVMIQSSPFRGLPPFSAAGAILKGGRPFVSAPRSLSPRWVVILAVAFAASAAAADPWLEFPRGELTVRRTWHVSTYGTNIGANGLALADLDGDGQKEVVAGAGRWDYEPPLFWYVLDPRDGYRHRWSSPAAGPISSLRTHDLDGDGAEEVLVSDGRRVHVYAGLDPVLQRTIATSATWIRAMEVADVDADGALELVACDAGSTQVHDLSTGVRERSLPFGCWHLALGKLDSDSALEIVIANDTANGYVVDGASGAVEWDNTLGFGGRVVARDLDGDGDDEVIAGDFWYRMRAWEPVTRTALWTHQFHANQYALAVADVDADGRPEVLYGDGQWGGIHGLDGLTGVELFFVPHASAGTDSLTVGELDGDAGAEIVFGGGGAGSSPDYLHVLDLQRWAADGTYEFVSEDINGPFLALAIGDIDGDAATDLLYCSLESDQGYGQGRYFAIDGSLHDQLVTGTVPASSFHGLRRAQIAQLDGDAAGELCFGSGASSKAHVLCEGVAGLTDGRLIAPLAGLVRVDALAVGDVDADGAPEIVAAPRRTASGGLVDPVPRLHVFDGRSGGLKWLSPPLTYGWEGFPFLRLADVDLDPALEILLGEEGGSLRVFDGNGPLQLVTGDLDLSALEVADVDGRGGIETIVGTTTGRILVVDSSGSTVDLGAFGGRIDGLAVHDMNGDAVEDLIFAVGGELRIVNGTDRELLWTSGFVAADAGRSDSIRAGDFDADGQPEILLNAVVGVSLYEVEANAPPSVEIVQPIPNATFVEGDEVTLAAMATDLEDGDLSATVSWSSDRDGHLGTGGVLVVSTLSPGAHHLTARAQDASGASGSATVDIRVLTDVPLIVGQVLAASRTVAKGERYAQARVQVTDLTGRSVGGARVSVRFEGAFHGFGSGVTAGDGWALVELGPRSTSGRFTACVQDVSRVGYVYSPEPGQSPCARAEPR